MYGNETWHTDRVFKPHVYCHTNITSVLFAAPSGVLNPTGVGKFGDFQHIYRCISETVQDMAIVTIIH